MSKLELLDDEADEVNALLEDERIRDIFENSSSEHESDHKNSFTCGEKSEDELSFGSLCDFIVDNDSDVSSPETPRTSTPRKKTRRKRRLELSSDSSETEWEQLNRKRIKIISPDSSVTSASGKNSPTNSITTCETQPVEPQLPDSDPDYPTSAQGRGLDLLRSYIETSDREIQVAPETVSVACQTEQSGFQENNLSHWTLFNAFGPRSRKISVSIDPLFFRNLNLSGKEFIRNIPANFYEITEWVVATNTEYYNWLSMKNEMFTWRWFVVTKAGNTLALHFRIPCQSWFNFKFMSVSTLRIHLIKMYQKYVLHY